VKAFFLSRALREKILLVALIVGAAAMWLSGAGKRAGKFWREVSSTSMDLKEQEIVLGQKDLIEARAHAAIEQLDPSRTFDPVRLQSEINTIANAAGLGSKTSISSVPSDKAGQFQIHSVQVVVRNADYDSLTKFYTELQKRSPYIGIVSFDVASTSPANGYVLTQSMRISSMQF
jgi:type II secretory pathway component PulK